MSQSYYCKYCGTKASSISSLTGWTCPRHPDGPNKGRHVLYEGAEKSSYSCRYCGNSASSISTLTAWKCPRHPRGANSGNHEPSL